MKTQILSIMLLAAVLLFSTCKDEDDDEPCKVIGTTVNIGSTTGGHHFTDVNTNSPEYTFRVYFNNTNLNFSVYKIFTNGAPSILGKIMDTGHQTCLDFATPSTPSASEVAYIEGRGYYGVYDTGATVKFIAKKYSGGSVTISYIFQ